MFGFSKPKRIGRLGDIQSFLIYYGPATPEIKKRIMTADLAILELLQWEPADIAEIEASGTAVYGYLSVMESPDWHTRRTSAMNADDIFRDRGKPVYFEQWKSVLMDLRSPGYRSLLLAEAEEVAGTYAPSGLFLDTVGDIEDYVPYRLQHEMSAAYRSFLSAVSERHPSLKRVQNRGFTQLETCSHLLDGFVWEGFHIEPSAARWVKHWISELAAYQKNGLTVFTVSEHADPRLPRLAGRNGFIHWTSPEGGYNHLD